MKPTFLHRNGLALLLAIGISLPLGIGQGLQGEGARPARPVVLLPATGGRSGCWALFREGAQGGRPGEWAMLPASKCLEARRRLGLSSTESSGRRMAMIRAGDPIFIEEHSEVADLCLRAEALDSAHFGEHLRAKLSVGGAVIPVVATGPGHARLIALSGKRP